MKSRTTPMILAVILALIVLAGVTWALAWRKPSIAVAEASAPAASQGLPVPYLNHPEVVDAPFDNPPFPTIDGAIAPGEYAGADRVTFPGHGVYYDEVEVFFVEDGLYLYIAFDVPLYDLSSGSSYVDVYLDLDHDHVMGSNDYLLRVGDSGLAREYTPTVGGLWGGETNPVGWTAAMTNSLVNGGWQVEYRIEYAKLGISAGTFKELGLALGTVDQELHFWPPDARATDLTLWGSLVSSSEWGISPITGGPFYWKPGPWEDYAISGMPDFDQRQNSWFTPTSAISTHCGPVAMANSLWWFDSKFETLTGTSPLSSISDSYRLVTSYNPGGWDDHDPQNVIPLVDDLANNYFGTNQGVQGTNVINMFYGTHQYLRDHGLWDDYVVTLVEKPDFDWVADEVMRSEDVILLLGFWQEQPPGSGTWTRLGGHYVNVAGVDPIGPMIAFSDPYVDAAEGGLVPGHVLSGTLILPHLGGHGSFVHNDAGNVSHDIYPVVPTNSPGGKWGPDLYPWNWFIDWFFPASVINPHPSLPPGPLPFDFGLSVQVEVEFALTVSPYTWKSSGYWEPDATDPVSGTWRYWEDYAPNGVPDFNQRQDQWIHPLSITWSYCGPVAAANSLWWFDSKFEPLPVGPPQPPPPPPPAPPLSPPPPAIPAAPLMPGAMPPADGYPLVLSYWGPGADDHDPANVETGLPSPMPPPQPLPWPPAPTALPSEFVDELAAYFDTDGQLSGIVHAGTVITDMYVGIEQYIIDRPDPSLPPGITLRQGYVITMTHSPDFWWVAEEIEHSEDVILLLGFWQNQDGDWVRLGGHYLTAVGVDKQGGYIGFSDPWYDGVEWAWPYAYPQGTPVVIGRAADGWMYLHTPYYSHPAHMHNDAGNISHDVYRARSTDSPGGVWGPWGYLETWEGNFEAQNGGKTGTYSSTYPLPQTEVDGAIAVSPVADVWVTKSATPTTLNAGDTVTFTIQFGNYGSLPAEDVVLTDTLPSGLTNATFAGYWTSNGLTVTHRVGTTLVWDLPDLAWLEWGIITVTAEVDPSHAWTGQDTITNAIEISTSSIEQYQITELANTDDVVLTVETPDLSIVKTVVPTGTVAHGDWVTFTITYSNAGTVTAYNIVITDTIPLSLTNAYTTSVGPVITATGSTNYVWQVANLAPGTGGVITITAQVDNTWPFITSMQNDAIIDALYDPNTSNNQSTVTVPVRVIKVYLPVVVRIH
jgi:uncharacterized repeat protein (TIGR01451 family)